MGQSTSFILKFNVFFSSSYFLKESIKLILILFILMRIKIVACRFIKLFFISLIFLEKNNIIV